MNEPFAPTLPPRHRTGLTEHASVHSGTGAFTPAALLQHLTELLTGPLNHKHIFCTCHVETSDNRTDSIYDDVEDKENLPPPSPSMHSTRYICLICHTRLILSAENATDHSRCNAENYLTHHYHQSSSTTFRCCGCEYTIQSTFVDPVLPIHLLTSPEFSSPIEMLSTLKAYVNDLFKHVRRNINTSNPAFSARIGLNDTR